MKASRTARRNCWKVPGWRWSLRRCPSPRDLVPQERNLRCRREACCSADGMQPLPDGRNSMSILKKLMVSAALAASMFATAAVAEPVKIGLVVKSLGNGFFDAANKGAQEAAAELGETEVIYTGPT